MKHDHNVNYDTRIDLPTKDDAYLSAVSIKLDCVVQITSVA